MPFNRPAPSWRPAGKLLLAGFCLALLFSCKKAIERQQQNLIMDAMTNGRWVVELYNRDTANITTAFLGYEFQFYQNGSVDGIKNNLPQTGAWTADIDNRTITAGFPATAGDTLKLLNYTWKITDSNLSYVAAKTSTAAGTNILHLRKK